MEHTCPWCQTQGAGSGPLCPNCGGPLLATHADGGPTAVDLDLLVRVKNARADVSEQLGALGRSLKRALGVNVHYTKRGLYGNGKFVSLIALVGDTSFRAVESGGVVHYAKGPAINGVASVYYDCGKDEWCRALATALTVVGR